MYKYKKRNQRNHKIEAARTLDIDLTLPLMNLIVMQK